MRDVREVIDKARVLIEALPYIKEFRGRTMVVKIGGVAQDDLELRRRFAEDVVLLSWVGVNVVVVHGGGKQVSSVLDKLGIEARFEGGLRVTDRPTLEVVEMVLGGSLNKELVRLINQLGGRAIGLTGVDGGLARARRLQRTPDLGLVGEISHIDRRVLDRILPEFIPIIAPLAVGEDHQTLNVNADPFAAEVAQALGAEKLVLLTDVEGVKDGAGALIPSLTPAQARGLIDGRLEHALLLEIFTTAGVGTQFVAE